MGATLQNWSRISLSCEFCVTGTTISGVVNGHPHHADGRKLRVGPIVYVKGRLIRTTSGTLYRLGRIDPRYRMWLRDQHLDYNPKQPLGE
jgi:hypothetical protein